MMSTRSWKTAKEFVIDLMKAPKDDAEENMVRIVIVKGMPGAGKTKWAIEFVREVPGTYIIAVPRRTLREWMIKRLLGSRSYYKVRSQTADIYVNRYGMTVVRFRMKYEFEDCPLNRYLGNIKDVILNSTSDPYLRAVLDRLPPYAAYMLFCLAFCRKRKENTCPFLNQLRTCIELAKRRKHVIYVATHMGAMVLSMVLRGSLKDMGKVVTVVDEFDELNSLSRSFEIPRTVVEMMRRSGIEELKILADRIEKTWIYDNETDTYLPHIVRFDADIVIAISATPLEYAFKASENADIVVEYVVPLKKPTKDVWIQLNSVHTIEDIKGLPETVVNVVEKIIRLANERNMTVGIIMPKKYYAILLKRALNKRGIDVYYGKIVAKAYRSTNTIIVPNDHLYRGLSMDKDVIIAFYQQWNYEEIIKNLHPEIKRYLGYNDYAIFRTAQSICMASNVQALFRFIRNHYKRHIIISMDKRVYQACNRFMKHYLADNVVYHEALDYEHLVSIFEDVINRLLPT